MEWKCWACNRTVSWWDRPSTRNLLFDSILLLTAQRATDTHGHYIYAHAHTHTDYFDLCVESGDCLLLKYRISIVIPCVVGCDVTFYTLHDGNTFHPLSSKSPNSSWLQTNVNDCLNEWDCCCSAEWNLLTQTHGFQFFSLKICIPSSLYVLHKETTQQRRVFNFKYVNWGFVYAYITPLCTCVFTPL